MSYFTDTNFECIEPIFDEICWTMRNYKVFDGGTYTECVRDDMTIEAKATVLLDRTGVSIKFGPTRKGRSKKVILKIVDDEKFVMTKPQYG